MKQLTIVVATDAKGGIGINNTLPWRLPEDLAHFKRVTSGHTVIMGRKTFDSIGRPLPNRRNIVITRNADWRQDGVETALSLDQAVSLAGHERSYIIGGAQIYAESIAMCDQLVVTQIGKVFDCDAYFPAIDPAMWREVARETHHSEANGFDYAFVTYERT